MNETTNDLMAAFEHELLAQGFFGKQAEWIKKRMLRLVEAHAEKDERLARQRKMLFDAQAIISDGQLVARAFAEAERRGPKPITDAPLTEAVERLAKHWPNPVAGTVWVCGSHCQTLDCDCKAMHGKSAASPPPAHEGCDCITTEIEGIGGPS